MGAHIADDRQLDASIVLDAALSYASRGWLVLPCWGTTPDLTCACGKLTCDNIGKHPIGLQGMVPHGLNDATTDPETIRAWWKRFPRANVAIGTGQTSGIVVIDVDPRHDGDESLRDLEMQYGTLPDTIEAITGGRGRHILLAHPGAYVPNRQGAKALARGVDVRADGGFVIAPPSLHRSGQQYAWDAGFHPDDTSLAPISADWLRLLRSDMHQEGDHEPLDVAAALAGVPEGQREGTLFRLACRLRGADVPYDYALSLIRTSAGNCSPPFDADMAKEKVDRAYRLYPPNQRLVVKNAVCSTTTSRDHLEVHVPSALCLADVEPKRVAWLWHGRIPLGKLTVLDGDPGLGKSTLALDVAARASTGQPMPDGSVSDLDGPSGVILLSAEDDPADTIRPRLDAARADVSRIWFFDEVPNPPSNDSDGQQRPPSTHPATIPADVPTLEALITRHNAKLVIVDPLMAYLSSANNAHRDQDVRGALKPLAKAAQRTGAAVVVIRHLNKATGGNALYRGGGSIGIVAAARSGLLVGKDPDDETGERRVLVSTKSNLSVAPPALAYHLEVHGGNTTACVVWEGTTAHTAATLLASPIEAEERSKLDEAKDFLREVLADGPRTAKEVIDRASAAGIAEKTLRKAKQGLGITSTNDGFGPGHKSLWSLTRLTVHGRPASMHGIHGQHAEEGMYAVHGHVRAEGAHGDATSTISGRRRGTV